MDFLRSRTAERATTRWSQMQQMLRAQAAPPPQASPYLQTALTAPQQSPYQEVPQPSYAQMPQATQAAPYQQVPQTTQAAPHQQVPQPTQASPYQQMVQTTPISPTQQMPQTTQAFPYQQVPQMTQASPYTQVRQAAPTAPAPSMALIPRHPEAAHLAQPQQTPGLLPGLRIVPMPQVRPGEAPPRLLVTDHDMQKHHVGQSSAGPIFEVCTCPGYYRHDPGVLAPEATGLNSRGSGRPRAKDGDSDSSSGESYHRRKRGPRRSRRH